MKNPIVTQPGSRCDNFTVHESHGLAVYPSTYYIDPNNVHQHLDQGPRAVPLIQYMCTVHPPAYGNSIVLLAALNCLFQFEDESKSQRRREEAKRECHCYLLELQSLDKLQSLWF